MTDKKIIVNGCEVPEAELLAAGWTPPAEPWWKKHLGPRTFGPGGMAVSFEKHIWGDGLAIRADGASGSANVTCAEDLREFISTLDTIATEMEKEGHYAG